MYNPEQLREKFVFRVSPLLDLALSLLVIENPERFQQADAWIARVKSRLSDQTLAKLHEAAEQTDLLAVVLDLEKTGLPAQEALEHLRKQNEELAVLLLDYWQAIAPEIADHIGQVAVAMQQDQALLSKMDPLAFLCRLSDRISVTGDRESIVLQWGKGMRIPLTDLEQIVMVPSYFCPRRLMFYRQGPLQVFFYSPGSKPPQEFPDAPEKLTLGLTALADPTRLKLLRLITTERLPAQDMARRLDLNESTVSRHLRLLMEAGLVAREGQQGRFILYSFVQQRIDDLLLGLREYLFRGEDV